MAISICNPSCIELFNQPSPSGISYTQTFFDGIKWTLELSAVAWIIALVLGLFIGIGLTVQSKAISRLCSAYVEIFRNIPLLVQLFLWYYVIPQLLPEAIKNWILNMAYPGSAFFSGVLCLGLFTSARIAVQLSSGIRSIPRGQTMAGTALGLTRQQLYRYVLLPVAGRVILPPLTSEALNLLKNSSLAFTIGLIEVTGAAKSMQEFTFQTFPPYLVATLLYVGMNLLVLLIMSLIEKSVRVPGFLNNAK